MTPTIDQAERVKVIAARMNRGQDTYAGRVDGWHKLGQVFGVFTTWKDMIVAAKADYQVVKKQLEWKGKLVDAWGTFRADNEPVKGAEDRAIRVQRPDGSIKFLTFLSSVGDGYEVIQHTEGFELMDELVGQIDGAHYETMGTLDYGSVVWGQVDPNISIKVGDDESKVLLSFLTSHDGSKAFDIYETAIRQVCKNTVRIGSLNRLAATLRVKHTKNSGKRIDNLKVEIEEIRSTAMTMQERLNYLSRKRVTVESLTSIMERLFPKKAVEPGQQQERSTRRDNILAEILSIYEDNDGNQFPEQRGTPYNLLNAITNYTDHFRSTKGDMRAESALFGSGDKLKTSALQTILEAAKGMPDKLFGSNGRGEGINVDWETVGLKIPQSAR